MFKQTHINLLSCLSETRANDNPYFDMTQSPSGIAQTKLMSLAQKHHFICNK